MHACVAVCVWLCACVRACAWATVEWLGGGALVSLGGRAFVPHARQSTWCVWRRVLPASCGVFDMHAEQVVSVVTVLSNNELVMSLVASMGCAWQRVSGVWLWDVVSGSEPLGSSCLCAPLCLCQSVECSQRLRDVSYLRQGSLSRGRARISSKFPVFFSQLVLPINVHALAALCALAKLD